MEDDHEGDDQAELGARVEGRADGDTVEGPVLGALLGTFVGFFLYVGAAELLPEAHRKERGGIVMAATVVGVAFMSAVTRVATGF